MFRRKWGKTTSRFLRSKEIFLSAVRIHIISLIWKTVYKNYYAEKLKAQLNSLLHLALLLILVSCAPMLFYVLEKWLDSLKSYWNQNYTHIEYYANSFHLSTQVPHMNGQCMHMQSNLGEYIFVAYSDIDFCKKMIKKNWLFHAKVSHSMHNYITSPDIHRHKHFLTSNFIRRGRPKERKRARELNGRISNIWNGAYRIAYLYNITHYYAVFSTYTIRIIFIPTLSLFINNINFLTFWSGKKAFRSFTALRFSSFGDLSIPPILK